MTRRMLGPALLGSAFVIALSAAQAGGLPEGDEFSSLPQVAADELGSQSGGTDVEVGDVSLNLAVTTVELNGQFNGSGTLINGAITNNAVNNVRGINSVMYNTGNNVALSSNIQLNVTLK